MDSEVQANLDLSFGSNDSSLKKYNYHQLVIQRVTDLARNQIQVLKIDVGAQRMLAAAENQTTISRAVTLQTHGLVTKQPRYPDCCYSYN